jgi:hypothetical protein
MGISNRRQRQSTGATMIDLLNHLSRDGKTQ